MNITKPIMHYARLAQFHLALWRAERALAASPVDNRRLAMAMKDLRAHSDIRIRLREHTRRALAKRLLYISGRLADDAATRGEGAEAARLAVRYTEPHSRLEKTAIDEWLQHVKALPESENKLDAAWNVLMENPPRWLLAQIAMTTVDECAKAAPAVTAASETG